MNDGQYTNLRNYLEEIASTSKQVLEAQKRTNALLEKQAGPTVAQVKAAMASHLEAEGIKTVKDEPPAPVAPVATPDPTFDVPPVVVKDAAPDTRGKKPGKSDLPWPSYDTDSEEAIIARLRNMPPDERNKALAYERKNKNRINITRVQWNSFA